jgi:plasmid stabilization system protein ParE
VKFTVIWAPPADRVLTAIWLAARDRIAVTAAARQIVHRLGTDPANAGESRDPGRRITFEGPLAVLFRVDETPYTVRILRVWRVQQHL